MFKFSNWIFWAVFTAGLGLGAGICEAGVLPPGQSSAVALADTSMKDELLSAHNRYRDAVGVPHLQWSDTLAESAQEWADQLAATNSFQHSSSGYGENLWKGTAEQFSLTQMVDSWGSEQQYFIPNAPFPDVSTTGNWADVGHYTQIVWEGTTEVGCAIATGGGWDILVCQYNPPGNFVGDRPF